MSWTASCLLAFAALALGQALQVNNGFIEPRAIAWLFAALALLVSAVLVGRSSPGIDRAARVVLPAVLLGGVVYQVSQLLWARPLMYAALRHGRTDPVFSIAFEATAILAAIISVAPRRVRCIAFGGIVAAHVIAGSWAIRTVPTPPIDVVTVQQTAIRVVARGRNPYSITFSNIYGKESAFYAAGAATESRVLFGFPYPPLTLAFSVPADRILGDYRYAGVACLAGAALLIASIGWTRHAMLAATVLLTTPRVLFVVEQGWTEPYAVFLLTLTAAVLARAPSKGAIPLGLMMAVKQYLAVALALAPLLPRSSGTPRATLVLKALATAAAVTLPFVVWNPRAFLDSVVLLQFREPFRADSLSFLVWLAGRGLHLPVIAATLVAAVLAVALALRRLPPSAAGFSTGMALVTFALFAFGKKAFCNYYFFVLGALAVAIAASGDQPDRVEPTSTVQLRD